MTAAALPQGPEDITADWLSGVLGRDVARVSATRIGEDQGFTGGRLYRLDLGGGTLIAKLSPAGGPLRAAFARANAREVEFYRRFAPGLPAPGCHFARFDPQTGASILLLQDLGHCRARAFVDGLGAADARALVASLAQLHAAWWNAPDLAGLSGSGFLAEFSFADHWQSYRDRVAEILPDVTLPAALIALGDHVAAHQQEIFAGLLDRGPLTVLHRDCQADNVMFAPEGRALLLDWQFMGRGRGAYDLAYALTSSMTPAVRRREERALVAFYHRALTRLGVRGYDPGECWADYRRSVVAKLNVTVMATVMLDNSSPAKRDWRRADLCRLVAFVGDHAIGADDFAR